MTQNNYQKIIIFLGLVLLSSFFAFPEISQAATYYLDANSGNDSSAGTITEPWKTLAKAQSVVVSGDMVLLQAGDYGSYAEANHIARTSYITYQAAAEATVHLDNIYISNSVGTDAYLSFVGMNIKPDWVDPCTTGQVGCEDPQYPDSTQSTYSKTAHAVTVVYANHVKIINCSIEGQSKHLTDYGVSIAFSQDVTVDNCSITKVQRGVNMMNDSTGVNVLNNHIFDIGASAIVQGTAGCTNALIEGNHAHNSRYLVTDDYAPRAVGADYHGSFVALRDGNVTVRNNVFHDGGRSSGMMTYTDGSDHFDNVIIENNLLYDIRNPYVLRFYLMGDDCIVRNNTFISMYRGGNDGRYKYETALAVHSFDTDGSPHLTLSNNIFIGAAFIPEDSRLSQNNNIFYSWYDSGTADSGWECNPNNGSVVFTCLYGDHPTTELTTPFNCGSSCSFLFPLDDWDGVTMDYTLAVGSQAINLGNVGLQTTDSLGSIGADGFLVTNGSTRTGTNHSAGAYEYIPSGDTTPPAAPTGLSVL